MDKALLEHYLEQGLSLPQIGVLVNRDPSTVGYWVQKHGLVANGRDKCAPRGGLKREQIAPLLEEGFPVRVIAENLGVHSSTVHYWIRRHDLPRPRVARRKRIEKALRAGNRVAVLPCKRHGETEFVLVNNHGFRCRRCRMEAVARRRRKVKRMLVEEAGGKCTICGYDRCSAALHFHHVDPKTKSFALSVRGITRSIAKLREEARKCVLLCSNCHAEVEAGYTSLDGAVLPSGEWKVERKAAA